MKKKFKDTFIGIGVFILLAFGSTIYMANSEEPEEQKKEQQEVDSQKETEKAEKEAKEKADLEAQQQAEREAEEKAAREAQAQAEHEAQEKAAREAQQQQQVQSKTYQNCTELRQDYPNGVASTHPAYEPKMDRDKDNWACER